ncbi:MAG TPA: MBL fold metallo-hydrolase [Anaerolineae bacterium]|nr:MBL fold metallo-hydrolase [Anaerolineae bacterium]HQI86453.1 MBL fold metallo-hydrolase [Anaerolineae bacterium]
MEKTDNTTQVTGISLGAMGQVFLVRSSAGAILVDTGLPNQADRILKALAAQGVAPQDIRLILITHGHMDHIGSVKELHERTGAPVAVHSKDAGALRGEQDLAGVKPTTWLSALMMRVTARMAISNPAPTLEPDIVFDEAWRLDDYGIAGEVIPTPGHSPGSISVLLDSGAAIIGDLAMGSMLFPKRATPPLIAWDLERNWASLRAVLDRHPTIIYITHGHPLTPDALHTLLKRHA